MQKSCNGCIRRRRAWGAVTGCHYLYDTGEPRGCSVDDCNKKAKSGYIIKADQYGRDTLVFIANKS